MHKLITYVVLILILGSCSPDELSYDVQVDATLQPYVDLFIAEAAARGEVVDFSANGLIAELVAIDEQGVPGQCQQNSAAANELRIDPVYWNAYSEEERELLIFHELGHCYLKRDHDNTTDGNGNCISIMRAGSSVCEVDWDSEAREVLLDELFSY